MKSSAKQKVFDFEAWSELAEKDPQQFEQRRLDAIEKLLETMPAAKQQRLRGLQWRIDQERKLSKTPMAACIKLSEMMWENLVGKNGLVDAIRGLEKPSEVLPDQRDNVLPFRQNA